MGTKISIAILACLAWLSTTSAGLNSTGPQKFTDEYQDNIALPQQYKEVIMYLTPSEIRKLQQTQEQHGFILPSPTAQPETPRDNDDRRNYLYPNNENSEQDQPRQASSSQGYNKYSENREASYSGNRQRDSGAPVAESTYSYRDQNSYVYNRIKTMLLDNEKYIAPKVKNVNPQLKQYMNPQITTTTTTTTTTEKPKAREQQEGLSEEEWQAAYNYLELESAKESSDNKNKESSYRGQNSLSDPNKLPSYEQSTYDQRNAYSNFQPGRFYPMTNIQESRQTTTTEAPARNQETLLIPSNLDRDTQLIFKNRYQLVPYYPETKNNEEHTVLLQELLNQRIPEKVKTYMFQNTQSQMPEKQNENSQNAPNSSNEGLLPEESQKILLRIMSHNLEAHAQATALNEIRENIRKNIKKNVPEETKKLIINMIMKNMEAKAKAEAMSKMAAMKPKEEVLSEEAKRMLQTLIMKNMEAQAKAEAMSKMPPNQPNQGALPEESKNNYQNAVMESQAKAAAISKLPPIIIRKEVKITKQTPLEWFNGQPVSQAVWWPATTVPEVSVPRVYQVPQQIVKPLGLPTLVRPEKVDLEKQVVDLEKHFSALEQKPAESASSFYSEARDQDQSASQESLPKPKKLTIIKHVWTD